MDAQTLWETQLTWHTSVPFEKTQTTHQTTKVSFSLFLEKCTQGYVRKMLEFHLCLTHPLLAQSIFQKVIYCSSEGSSIFEISHLTVNEIEI